MKTKLTALAVSLLVLSIGFFSLTFTMRSVAQSVGNGTGALFGTSVGAMNGYIEGHSQGTQDGKEAGLSAEDSTASIANFTLPTDLLEVMRVRIKSNNFNQIGEGYARITSRKATAIFTVDLSRASVRTTDTTITIQLPDVVSSVIMDSDADEITLAEYSDGSGSAKDAMKAVVNSDTTLQRKVEQEVRSSTTLKQNAQTAAREQVTQLVKTVFHDDVTVKVNFKTTEE